MTRPVCLGALLLAAAPAAASPRALVIAQDHRGNRLEPFEGIHGAPGGIHDCTRDHRWCAELRRDATDGGWTLHIVARERGLFAGSRHYRYPLPMERCCQDPAQSFSLWDEIVREPAGAALVGLVFSHETDGPGRFRSFQRRLFLLRVPAEAGGGPVPVLEAPLSGVVEQPVCRSAEDQRERPYACEDRFYFSTLFTLVPEIAPVEPANLVLIATAETSPDHRTRSAGPVLRAPVERTGDDQVPDPACTFTRAYYFDAAQGRYLPDAPLPACRDYLEP